MDPKGARTDAGWEPSGDPYAPAYKIWQFTNPLVANGKVFVGTGFGATGSCSNSPYPGACPVVHVYGLSGR